MIDPRRLKAPAEPFGTLIEPSAAEIGSALRGATIPSDCRVAGVPLAELRRELRVELGVTAPLILTGHQAEFFHAGVFAKVIAARLIADRMGGTPAFLTVDSDVPKTARLAVPHKPNGELRRLDVAIPGIDVRWPVEWQARGTAAQWRKFFDAVRAAYGRTDSALTIFEGGLTAVVERGGDVSDALAGGRAAVERGLGLSEQMELRISRLSETPAFRAFALHIMSDATHFAACYNAAQSRYRARHRIHTDQRPVPPLKTEGARVELPLWLLPPHAARRRVYVERRGSELLIFGDDEEVGRIDMRAGLQRGPWSFERAFPLRPRALALSAFARLMVADLFIHGIGGAKYDEITNDFLAEFFGVAPPPLACVSATLYLPIAPRESSAAELHAVEQSLREIEHRPWRFVDGDDGRLLARRGELVAESVRLRADEHRAHQRRRENYQRIHELDEQLLSRAAGRIAHLEQKAGRLLPQVQIERIAGSRDYFFGMHPIGNLQELAARFTVAFAAM